MTQDTERRGSGRTPIRVPVDYRHEGNYLISHSTNLSPDGIFVRTDSPPPLGTRVQLVFSVGELHELAVSAIVMWSPAPGSKGVPGMGLQFVDLPESLRDALLETVHRVALLGELDQESAPHGTA